MKYNKFGYLGAVLLIALSVYFVSLAASPAPTVKTARFDAGMEYYTSWASIDSSVANYYSDYFDISNIDYKVQADKMIISYSYLTTGGTSDSLTLTLEGKDANDVVQSLGTTILVGSTTGGATFATVDPTTYMLANIRYRLTHVQQGTPNHNANGGTLKISGYYPDLDVIPSSGQVRW